MTTILAIITSLFMLLAPQPAQLARCELNPQIDSACQPSMLPVGTPVIANGEAGTVWGYYLEGDSGQRVYVILLDAQASGVWVGRFVAPASVIPR